TMFSGGKAGEQRLFDRVADPAQPDWTYIALLFDGVWPVAAALADGELTYRQYRDDKLADPVIRALADKVDEIPDLTQGVFGATARVALAAGVRATASSKANRELRDRHADHGTRRDTHAPIKRPLPHPHARRRLRQGRRRHPRVPCRRGAERRGGGGAPRHHLSACPAP